MAAAAALAGLIFVALSLRVHEISAYPPYRHRAQITLSVLMLALVVAALALFPHQTGTSLGLEEFTLITVQLGVFLKGFARARQAATQLPPGFMVRNITGGIVLVVAMIGSVLAIAGIEFGIGLLALFCLVSLVYAVVNSWGLVIGIADEMSKEAASRG